MVNEKYTYAEWTMRKAFYNHTANWIRSPRKRRTKANPLKRGRKTSAITQSVLDLHRSFPDWTPSQLASALHISPGQVRSVLHRLRNGRYRHQSVTQFVVTNTQEEIGRVFSKESIGSRMEYPSGPSNQVQQEMEEATETEMVQVNEDDSRTTVDDFDNFRLIQMSLDSIPVGSHAVWFQKPEPNTFGVSGDL